MTVGGIAVLIVSAAAFIVLPLVLSFAGFGGITATLMNLLRWPLLFLLILCALGVLYRHGPHRAKMRVSWITVGSVFATVARLGLSALLSWYLSNFANYDATYGSLGAVAGMMMWLYVTFIVVLVGAEVNAELEHQTARDSTLLPEKPLGQRGAVMADTVRRRAIATAQAEHRGKSSFALVPSGMWAGSTPLRQVHRLGVLASRS